jgi:hypothetical protein
MKYIVGVLIPVLLQVLMTWLVIVANTGNGSWLGLGALLLAMFAIPLTALTNFVLLRSHQSTASPHPPYFKCLFVAVIMPILLVFLLALS